MYIDPRWIIVVIGSTAAFSSLSPLVHARRFSFFAASLPHSALFSIAIGYLFSAALGGHPMTWALVFSIPLACLLVFFIHRGVSEDSATSAFITFTVSGSVAAVYYVLTSFPAQVSLWSYILGDPLLTGWDDAWTVAAVGAVTVATSAFIYYKQVLIGLDRDFSALSGVRVSLHDYVLAILLTLSSVSLLKAVGFAIEHIVILLPATVATRVAKSAKEFYVSSILLALVASIIGLLLSILLNLAPAATFGFVLLALYLVSLLWGERT
ncbi:MAG: metal ABC transporter permease [Thermofilaceae archaeon]